MELLRRSGSISVCQKNASQSLRSQAQKVEIIFSGGMYVEENTLL